MVLHPQFALNIRLPEEMKLICQLQSIFFRRQKKICNWEGEKIALVFLRYWTQLSASYTENILEDLGSLSLSILKPHAIRVGSGYGCHQGRIQDLHSAFVCMAKS